MTEAHWFPKACNRKLRFGSKMDNTEMLNTKM